MKVSEQSAGGQKSKPWIDKDAGGTVHRPQDTVRHGGFQSAYACRPDTKNSGRLGYSLRGCDPDFEALFVKLDLVKFHGPQRREGSKSHMQCYFGNLRTRRTAFI